MKPNDETSILAEPQSTFDAGSEELKETVDDLIAEETPEAHDEIVQIAMDHGVPVTPEMDDMEIKNRIDAVL